MDKPEVKTTLSSLVKRARFVSSKVLNPMPVRFHSQVIDLDEVALMAGLQTNETLTEFHPFGAMPAEDYVVDKPDEVNPDEAKASFPELGKSALPGTNSGSEQSNQLSVFNTSLTHIVNDICNNAQKASSGNSGKIYPNELKSKRSEYKEKQDKDDLPLGQDLSGVAEGEKNIASEASNFIGESTVQLPVLNQLESLVENWQFSEVAEFLGKDAVRNSVSDSDNQVPSAQSSRKLDQLASVVDDYRFSPMTSDNRSSQENNKKEIVGVGESFERSKQQHSANTHAFADLMRRNPNSQMSEEPSGRLMQSGGPSDLAKVTPVLNSVESAVVAESPFSELSNLATQKVADALNDYLREQAELRGVDI